MKTKTVGISPKAIVAFLLPLISAIIGAAVAWAAGGFGTFDTTSIVIAATGVATSGLALLGAYVGKPGRVVPVGPIVVHGLSPNDPQALAAVGKAAAPAPPDENLHLPADFAARFATETVAPFTPDGDPTGDEPDPYADYPDESFIADPGDTYGANDHAVTA